MTSVPPASGKNNGMAITGFVLSLIPCLGLLGIVFSAIGMAQTKKDPSQGGRGLAIAGLIIGIVSTLIYWFWFGAALVGLANTDTSSM